jgi:hypothetical protein
MESAGSIRGGPGLRVALLAGPFANVGPGRIAWSGFLTEPGRATGAPRSVQFLEIAVDALNIAGIRPFWKTVLGYTDEAVPRDRRIR